MDIDDGMIAAFRKNIDEHGESERIFEDRVFSVDMSDAGYGVSQDDGNHLLFDHGGHLRKKFAMFNSVAVEPRYQFLPRMNDDGTCDRNAAERIHSAGVELERALVLKLFEDVSFDFLE